jgi:outer membrane lipoprotein SlyB
MDPISVIAARAGTRIVIIRIGPVVAMPRAIAEAAMVPLGPSGGAGGALLGNALGGGTAGTIVGGVAGALVGRTLDKKNTRDRNMSRNGC